MNSVGDYTRLRWQAYDLALRCPIIYRGTILGKQLGLTYSKCERLGTKPNIFTKKKTMFSSVSVHFAL